MERAIIRKRNLNRFLISFIGATALCGRLWAGPIGPASGVSLPAQDVILNQAGAQSGKTFSVSSATVSNIHTTTVTVGNLSGVVKATAGVLSGSATTTDLPEGSKQYFTVARATSAFTAVSPLQNNDGVLSIGPINLPSGSTSYIQNGTSPQVASFVVSTGTATKLTTTNLTVGTLDGVLKATSGSVGVGATTSDVPEGSRQYFTTARATSAVSATFPLTNINGVFAMPAATGSQNGYLTSGDWTDFNSKEPAITSGTSLQYWRGDKTFQTLNTTAVTEGTNQYFTTARATSAITGVSPIVNTNGVLTLTSALPSGATSYIRNTSTLQSGATFYVSSGTVFGQLSILSLKWPNGAVQTSSSTISAGGSSGATGSLQLSDGLGTFTSASVLVWDGSYLNTPRVHFGDPGESTTNTPTIRRNGTSFDFTNAFDPGSRFFFKTTSGDGLNVSDTGETQLSSGLSGATPDASAKLQLDSSDMGFLMPRMTLTERNAIASPATGLEIYNTTSNKLNFYNSATWEEPGGISSISTNTTGANSFIWNQNTLQSGATFYVSSGTVAGTLTAGTFSGSGASLTSVPAASIAAGSLGGSVIASSIAASGVTAGSYGSATQVPEYTVGGDGRLTAASNTTISLTNSNLQSGTYSNVTVPAANVAAGSLGSSVLVSSFPVTGVTAGSYTTTNLTVNAQGIITAAANGVSGSSGYAVQPATVTFQLNQGLSVSTISFQAPYAVKSIFLNAGSGLCQSNNGCIAATQYQTTTSSINYVAATFQAGTTEYWQTNFTLPRNYVAASTFTANFVWTTTMSVVSASWKIDMMSVANTGAIDTAWGTAVAVSTASTTTGALNISQDSGAITAAGSPNINQELYIRVYRNGDVTGDVRFLGVRLYYLYNKLSEN